MGWAVEEERVCTQFLGDDLLQEKAETHSTSKHVKGDVLMLAETTARLVVAWNGLEERSLDDSGEGRVKEQNPC